ncbi:vera protein [Truncatella angustata]|uniref:Vera protein n=1 Tax=Truncatella angustata TaxID=152316 RepID=A0A9P8UVQ0_9PEZI|nr:vera protein [Truncatella angustata]KAH6659217.1 vera protein [Truncatella angustata]
MDSTNTSSLWLFARAALGLATFYLTQRVAQWLFHGYTIRKTIKDMQALGVPTLPHSWLFGHLIFMGDFRKEHPNDSNIYNIHYWFLNNIERFFPGQETLPPVIYLDLWPVTSDAFLLSTHPAVSAQFTQSQSQPKAKMGTDFLAPLTQKKDIVSVEGEEWKSWRSRLNPGFSPRNVTALLPELVEEALVFIDGLKKLTGKDGSWGPVFQLEEKTMNLTFDIIIRATTNLRLHQQTRGFDTPLKAALLDQLEQMGRVANPARGLIHSLTPHASSAVHKNNKVMHDFFMPKVQDRIQSGLKAGGKRTIVDLALKQFDDEAGTQDAAKPDAEFLDSLLSNLKAFLFAGHDTTATTLCWMFKELQDNPDCLAKLREEHTNVLGPDVERAHEVILASPHLLYALPYTLAVIKETLRLYPLAAALRQGSAHYFLTVPGSPIRYPTQGFAMWDGAPIIQSRTDLWPRGDEFFPDRWLTAEGDSMYPPRILGDHSRWVRETASVWNLRLSNYVWFRFW